MLGLILSIIGHPKVFLTGLVLGSLFTGGLPLIISYIPSIVQSLLSTLDVVSKWIYSKFPSKK